MPIVSDERIQPALHALLSSDADALRSSLEDDPELIHASWNGNTLLEWTTQPPQGIDPDCIAALLWECQAGLAPVCSFDLAPAVRCWRVVRSR